MKESKGWCTAFAMLQIHLLILIKFIH